MITSALYYYTKIIVKLKDISYNYFGDFMLSIDKPYTNEIIINKSRFICKIYPVNNTDEIILILKNIKKEYKGATHYCYAYITGNIQKYSDDGEPTGTAGLPILNVIKNKNLENILVIVIRYFGGIKLGAGGLLRAYTKSVTDCLEISNIVEKNEGLIISVEINYENINKIYNLINQDSIKEKEYSDNLILTIHILKNEYENIKEELKKLCINIIEKESIYL